jgi:hypothetical protein
MGNGGSFPGGKARQGVMLTTHPLLVSRLRKSSSYTSSHTYAPLWSVMGPLYLYLTQTQISGENIIFIKLYTKAARKLILLNENEGKVTFLTVIYESKKVIIVGRKT